MAGEKATGLHRIALVGGLPAWRRRMMGGLSNSPIDILEAQELTEALPLLARNPVDVVLVGFSQIESDPAAFRTLIEQRTRPAPRVVVMFSGAFSVDRMKWVYDMRADQCEIEPRHASALVALLEGLQNRPVRRG